MSHALFGGVNVVCFAMSYTTAFALEITRPWFRSGIRGAVLLAFAVAGLFAHTVFLVHRLADSPQSLLASERNWLLLAAWAVAFLYVVLAWVQPRRMFGPFLLPIVLGLLAVGAFVADTQPFVQNPSSQVWGAIHGIAILLATFAVLVGFCAGLMYLGQAFRLKHRLPLECGIELPPLEWLERMNSRAVVFSLFMLALGVLSGMALNATRDGERVPWYDPVVLSTLLMVTWQAGAAGVSVFYRPARRGRKVVYVTIVNFLFLVIVLAAVLSLRTQHGRPRPAIGGPVGARPATVVFVDPCPLTQRTSA